MAPTALSVLDLVARADGNSALPDVPTRSSFPVEGDIVEAWAQGYNVGSLIILMLIVLCNYRKRVLLHKLILLEVSLFPDISLTN